MNRAQHRFKRGGFLLQQPLDVHAGCRAGAPQRDDALDLRKREAQATALLHERQDAEHVLGIEPIARSCPTRRRQDTARLVHAEGLTPYAAALNNLPDSHGPKVDPAPWGRVKRALQRPAGGRAEPSVCLTDA